MGTYIAVALAAYLLGSIPFGYILVRIFRKQDIRETGSGNIGATNVARSGAKGLAIATLLLDAGKGFAAVVITNMIWHPWTDPRGLGAIAISGRNVDAYVYLPSALAAVCAIAGHMFPVWLKFRGGKGVATAVGAFAALAPTSLAICFVVFLALVAVFRFVSLGSVAAAVSFPIVFYVLNSEPARSPRLVMLPAVIAASALIIFRHKDNIRRLLAGTEPKLGSKSASPPPQPLDGQPVEKQA